MTDVFLSYSREDQPTARRFAEGLQREGFSVWWDQTLNAGEAFDEVTEKALHEAKAVVVLWSKASVASRWVRAEASQADDNGTLVPVMIEPCNLPMKLRLTQTADLSRWKGGDDPAWRAFVAGLRRPVGGTSTQAISNPVVSSAASSIAPVSRRNAAVWITVGAVLLALATAALFYGQSRERVDATAVANPSSAVPQASPVSLAVLPFADLSPEGNQAYLADGLADEILNHLARIPDLAVTGRTSSFSFKGRNLDLRTIGEQLGVSNLLEGSVRLDGDQLRISAQLVDARSATNLWNKTYDRPKRNLFALQEELAADVAKALKVALDVGEMTRAEGGTTNLDAYDKYHRARTLHFTNSREGFIEAAQLYREALKLDPKFARAWYGLNLALSNTPSTPEEFTETQRQLETLTPDAWWTQASRVFPLIKDRKWVEADTASQTALRLAPLEKDVAVFRGFFLNNAGRSREALAYWQRVVQADPLSLIDSLNLQNALDTAGRREEAHTEYLRSEPLQGDHGIADDLALYRMMSGANVGNAALEKQFQLAFGSGELADPSLREVFRLRNDPSWARARLRQIFENRSRSDRPVSIDIAMLADQLGDKDLALDALESSYRNLPSLLATMLWSPFKTDLRADPRFKQIVRELGLVEYWRGAGWGDHCKPIGDTDFECK